MPHCCENTTMQTRLNMGESLMTHAMVFTAYDKAEGEALPSKWRVENVRAVTTATTGNQY